MDADDGLPYWAVGAGSSVKPDDQQNAGADGLPTISNLASSGRLDSGDSAAKTDNGAGVTSAGGESGLPHHTSPAPVPPVSGLSDERLAEIRRLTMTVSKWPAQTYARAIKDLLAEVDRLRVPEERTRT